MARLLVSIALLCSALSIAAAEDAAPPRLPASVDGTLVALVGDVLAARITDAQDGKGVAFTVSLDGSALEPLAVAPERLRDYQNVYYRIVGQAGAWKLEEHGFSPTGADPESKLIRRALGVPESKKAHMIEGRKYLLAPARLQIVLFAGREHWDFRAGAAPPAGQARTRAVVIRANEAVSLVVTQPITTANAREGTTLLLSIAEDIRADGLVAVGKGAAVQAKVVQSCRPNALGTPALLSLQLGPVLAVDGTPVPLAGSTAGLLTLQGRTDALFLTPADVSLPAGSRLNARTAQRAVVLAPVDEGG